MLLRRVMDHVKTQNWTAVGLDFLIVVIGLLVGFQINRAWQENRDRSAAADYIERIHSELLAGGSPHEIEAVVFNEERRQISLNAADVLNGVLDRDLTQEECQNIFHAHSLFGLSTNIPTLNELSNSGNLSIIHDRDLRSALSLYLVGHESRQRQFETVSRNFVEIGMEFPEYFDFSYQRVDNPNPPTFKGDWIIRGCDTQAMKSDHAFKLLYSENLSRLDFYYAQILGAEKASLGRLHNLLDAYLGVTHEDR